MSDQEKTRLKACPCGKVPDAVSICQSDGCKWAYVVGVCCGEWHIEFRTGYHALDSHECKDLALKAWDDAPRGVSE